MSKRAFKIRGLDCAEEVAALKRTVGPVVGGEENLQFNILDAKMTVITADTPSETIVKAVTAAGLAAEPWEKRFADTDRSFWQKHGRATMTVASGALTVAGFVLHWMFHKSFLEALIGTSGETGHTMPTLAITAYACAAVFGAWHVAPRALRAARSLRPDMNLLMTIAVIGAAVLGDWAEAAMVAFLFSLALYLEQWSVARARHAVGALLDLSPAMGRVIETDGTVIEKRVEEIGKGQVVLIRESEKIPVDGIVIRGESQVNQAPITGESAPIHKTPGDEVFAGTLNQTGTLEVRTERDAGDSTLARIVRMIEEAQAHRSVSEQWVEKFARIYTPLMIALATATVLIPSLLFGGNWGHWFYEGLVILVIACPCALVISTPVSIVAGLASAARQGVLIKGGIYLETAGRLVAVALDKTGTLTHGQPEVQHVIPFNGHTTEEILLRAMAIEAHSRHPLAQAVLRHGQKLGLKCAEVEGFRALPGEGAESVIEGRNFWIGSHHLMDLRGQETPEIHKSALALEDAGHSVIALGNEKHVCGMIGVADGVRPQAAVAVGALRRQGVEHVVMLTGDNEGTARAVAASCGVNEFHAELLPRDKVEAVSELVKQRGPTAMVGDGVNDAPAMAASSLGVAMGAIGTDAAIETADIALMSDDLSKLSWLIGHSRRAVRTIKQNIGFALTVKAAFIALAFAGKATLWMAIAADMGASLLVIANSLRLLRAKDE